MAHEKIVLFDGTSLDNWKTRNGKPATWQINEDGSMTVTNGDILSDVTHVDAHIHVEFWLPLMADKFGQERANSGVYVQGTYEIQVLDSYGIENPQNNDCGAIYGIFAPLTNATLPPETWQTYDIYFRAPIVREDGWVLEDGYITVLLNGVCIHNNLKLFCNTGGSIKYHRVHEGPLLLQDHHCPVRYRNIWIEKLDRDSDK